MKQNLHLNIKKSNLKINIAHNEGNYFTNAKHLDEMRKTLLRLSIVTKKVISTPSLIQMEH